MKKFLILAFLFVISVSAFASDSDSYGNIYVEVYIPTGNKDNPRMPVVGASVSVYYVNGTCFVTKTDAFGTVYIADLNPGVYVLVVEMCGKKVTQKVPVVKGVTSNVEIEW